MTAPSNTREALIVEVLGEVATLIRQVEALGPTLDQSGRRLADQLTGFEARVGDLTDRVKTEALKHIAVRTDEAARRSIEVQGRAMAQAARIAVNDEFGATLRGVHASLQAMVQQRGRRWETWLTHLAVAVSASAATWTLALTICRR